MCTYYRPQLFPECFCSLAISVAMFSPREQSSVGSETERGQLLTPRGGAAGAPSKGSAASAKPKSNAWIGYIVGIFILAGLTFLLVKVVQPEFHNPDDKDQVLTWEPYVVLNTVAVTIALMALGLPADLLLLGLSSSFCVMGIITTHEMLEGLSNSGVVAVATLCAVSAAIDKTKALKAIMANCLGTPSSNAVAMLRMAFPLCTLGTVFNNTPLVAVMIPIVKDWTKAAGLNTGYFMMPLSFITMLSACITTMGSSTNLLAVDLLPEANIKFLDLAPVGLFIMITGVSYCCFVGPLMLPVGGDGGAATTAAAAEDAKISTVSIDRYCVKMKIMAHGPFDGRIISSSNLFAALPSPARISGMKGQTESSALHGGDVIEASNITANDVATLVAIPGLEIVPAGEAFFSEGHAQHRRQSLLMQPPAQTGLVPVRKWVAASVSGTTGWLPTKRTLYEVVVAPGGLQKRGRQSMLGRVEIGALQVALSDWDCALVAVQGMANASDDAVQLQGGEILLVEILDPSLFQNSAQGVFRKLIPIPEGQAPVQVMVTPLDPLRPIIAVLGLAMCVVLSALNVSPLDATAILVGLSSILIGTLSVKDLYGAINGPVLLTVAGSFGVGSAFAKTGVASLLASSVLSVVENSGTFAVLAAVIMLALSLGVIVSNNTTVILLAPMVKDICERQNMSLKMVMIAVIYAANLSFATPFSYQTNMMVMPHGPYGFMDYVKFGVPMMLLCGVVALAGSYIFWG